jgi:hypothetical protein
MPENSSPSLPGASSELVEPSPAAVDLQALAEKIVALLRREIEIETERAGKFFTGT